MNKQKQENLNLSSIFNIHKDQFGFDFLKVNSYGNDFMIVHESIFKDRNPHELVSRLANVHFGVGFEQLLSVDEPKGAGDFDVKVYNADGSSAKMCGNGMISLASIFFQNVPYRDVCNISVYDGSGFLRSVAATKEFDGSVKADINVFTMEKVGGECLLDNGNRHVVRFSDTCFSSPEDFFDSGVDTSSLVWPGFNINYVGMLEDAGKIALITVENGVGETLLCGTGSCASVAWSINNPVPGRIYGVEICTKGTRNFSVKPYVEVLFYDSTKGRAWLKGICKVSYVGHVSFDDL